jgi:hypothetical protein
MDEALLDKLVAEATEAFARTRSAAELEQVKAGYVGKAGALTELLKGLGKLPPEERPLAGSRINDAKARIEEALAARREAMAQATLDARLAVGAVSEAIEVTAPLETLNRTSAEVGGLIEEKQIKEIPISGRNWASLMMLAPGAINYGDGSQRSIRFNGHSIDDANYTFDGIDNNGVQEQTQKAETRLNIALDSIAEFRVSTAVYTAESGAAGGAQVNVVSKTGSNAYHGGTFYSLRNDALDARSPFDGATIPPFTLHQFGANFGGPIKKDKLFFFGSYQGTRQRNGVAGGGATSVFLPPIPGGDRGTAAFATHGRGGWCRGRRGGRRRRPRRTIRASNRRRDRTLRKSLEL